MHHADNNVGEILAFKITSTSQGRKSTEDVNHARTVILPLKPYQYQEEIFAFHQNNKLISLDRRIIARADTGKCELIPETEMGMSYKRRQGEERAHTRVTKIFGSNPLIH